MTMLYVEYMKMRYSYNETIARLNTLLDAQEAAFTRTLPKAIRYDLQRVNHSPYADMLEDYLMDIEEIEEKIRSIRILVIERRENLDRIEEQLRKSKDLRDRIFVGRFIDGKSVTKLSHEISYSPERIYQILKEMKPNITKYYR